MAMITDPMIRIQAERFCFLEFDVLVAFVFGLFIFDIRILSDRYIDDRLEHRYVAPEYN